MSQRYFLTAESTYEDLRQSLNVLLQYPNALGKSVFQTALYAPRDNFRRVLLAVDTALPGYATVNAAIQPLLDSDAMEEVDEATYLAAVASATGGGATFTTVTDTLTYGNFLPSGGTLDLALSGIDTAISGKADASDFDQGVKTTDEVTFAGLTVDGSVNFTNASVTGVGFDAIVFANVDRILGSVSPGPGGVNIAEEIVCTAAGRALLDDADAAAQLATLGAAAVSHAHSASDITSGTVATARLGSGTASSSTFLRGDGTWASAGSTSASDLTSGTLANARMTTRARASMNLYLWSAFR